ncbi:MAG TPA: LysR family transcriptional regulator [Chromatiales bacterium]|nr:LysR family transcriptional regulator [Chromatiales bacterium]
MDISALQAFVTVAETGSFSRAAQQLHLTQPAVSKRVAQLEAGLNSRLFDRIGRRISLTESGQALLPRARTILLEVEDSKRAIGNLTDRVAGPLRIGTSHHIGLHRLPPVLRDFTTAFPEVELDLHFMDSELACRAVQHGDLELGIVTLPLNPLPELHSRQVWPDPLAFIVNPEHPLADQKIVSPAGLCDYPAILPAPGTYTREVIERAFAPLGLHIPIRMGTNYLETIKMMVSVGLGWSVLPRSMLDPDLRAIEVEGMSLARQLGVVWHGARTLSNPARAMLDRLP